MFFPRVMIMYVIAASAFLFYVSKIPERYFPGNFFCSIPVNNYNNLTKPNLSRNQLKIEQILTPLFVLCPYRPAELSWCQSPALARSGGRHVLLVAPDRYLHHELQTQSALQQWLNMLIKSSEPCSLALV